MSLDRYAVVCFLGHRIQSVVLISLLLLPGSRVLLDGQSTSE